MKFLAKQKQQQLHTFTRPLKRPRALLGVILKFNQPVNFGGQNVNSFSRF